MFVRSLRLTHAGSDSSVCSVQPDKTKPARKVKTSPASRHSERGSRRRTRASQKKKEKKHGQCACAKSVANGWLGVLVPPLLAVFYFILLLSAAPHRTVVDGCLGIICGGRLVEKERAGSMPPPALLLLLLRVIRRARGHGWIRYGEAWGDGQLLNRSRHAVSLLERSA